MFVKGLESKLLEKTVYYSICPQREGWEKERARWRRRETEGYIKYIVEREREYVGIVEFSKR